MEAKLTSEALEDKAELEESQWEEIKSKVKEISKKLSHKDLKIVPNPLLNHAIWQLTVSEENTKHRVYLDLVENKLIVLANSISNLHTMEINTGKN